jgi:hypothetical protein
VHVKRQQDLQHACRLGSRETWSVVVHIIANSTGVGTNIIGTNTTAVVGHADRAR